MKVQCKQGMIPILVFRLVLVTLTTPCRTAVSVSVVWATELLLNMRKLNPPSAQKIAKKTDTMVVDGLTQSSATLTMLILPNQNQHPNLSPSPKYLKNQSQRLKLNTHTLTLVATETMGLEI